MATDKEAVWADGEAQLWYSPNSTLDVAWNDGEAWCLDEYVAVGGSSGKVAGITGPAKVGGISSPTKVGGIEI
jgi:hypothetical protein